MKLFYAPGACSIGIHVLLEEIGAPYEAQKLDTRGGENNRPPFSDLNPKGKVPTLQRDDGRVITEFPVIAHWLGKQFPDAKLLPKDAEAALSADSAMDYCVATIHMQGFSRLFRPSNFSPNESDHDKVKARGTELVEKGYKIMADQLGGKDYVAGEFSVADAALFYVEWWGGQRLKMTLPGPLDAHLQRMMARPAVQRTLAAEGFGG